MLPFAHHSSSHSSQVSMRPIVARKSPYSTPAWMKRAPQWLTAACTRASGTGDHLLEARPKVAQHHNRRVAPRNPGDRSTHARGRAGLVEAADRHAVRRPARHRPELAAERVAAVSAVEGAVNHVRVRPFDVLRA